MLSDGKQKFALVDLDTGGPFEKAIRRASALTGIPVDRLDDSQGQFYAILVNLGQSRVRSQSGPGLPSPG